MLTGILIVLASFAVQSWLGRRAFQRRNQAGLQTFSSYGKAVGTQAAEGLLRLLSRIVLFVGLVWVGSAWLVGRM